MTAYVWFARAAQQGDAKAKQQLGDLRKSITAEQRAEAEARLKGSIKR